MGDTSLVIKREINETTQGSFLPPSNSFRVNNCPTHDKMNLIGIKFVDKDKTKLTDKSFDEKNKLPGPNKMIVEKFQAPLVSVVKNRDTFQIKQMLEQNPGMTLEELTKEKFGVTYRFLKKD